MASAVSPDAAEGTTELAQDTVVVALRNDELGVQALKWALNAFGGKPADGRPVIFMLLHIVSDVPNGQAKLVRVSEADADMVAIHLRDRVLPFLESMQDLCDLNEAMSSIEVVKDDLRPEAIVDSAIRLQATTLVMGGSVHTTTWGTIAHCTAPGKTPANCRVIVVTNGRRSKEVSPDGTLVPMDEDEVAVPVDPMQTGSSRPPLPNSGSGGDISKRADFPPRPTNSSGLHGVSLFSGKKRGKKPTSGNRILVKQRSEERSSRDDDSVPRSLSSYNSSKGTNDAGGSRGFISLFGQLSSGRSTGGGGKALQGNSSSVSGSLIRHPSDKWGSMRSGNMTMPPGSNAVEGAPQRGVPRGRITIYTQVGCEKCLAAKNLLKSKGSAYVDICLDVYPERRKEMESKSYRTTVPQVFFNGYHIGDFDAMQGLDQQGELEAMIEDVYDTDPPDNAPVPPGLQKGGGKGDPLTEQPDDEHVELLRRMRQGVSVQDRLHTFYMYHDCFVGSDAVGWLKREEGMTKEEALVLGNELLTKRFIHHVNKDQAFEDAYLFYKFVEDSGSITNRECLNYSGAIWPKPMRPVGEVTTDLAKVMQALFDENVSPDGKWIDYARILESDVFKRYAKRSEELHRFALETLDVEAKLALLLNVYNMMVVQVVGGLGGGSFSLLDLLKFFNQYTYLIGGSVYSLLEIQNGILRGNKKSLNAFAKPFSSKDARVKIALPECEPLIHFALITGTRSSPALRVYHADTVMDQLKEAAREFIRNGGVVLDVKAKRISLSKLFSWYEKDFGKSGYDVVVWIAQYMDELPRADLLQLAREMSSCSVQYQEYDSMSNNWQL